MMPVLTLQYPDQYEGKLRIIASTYDPKAMLAFKRACLQDTQLKTMGWIDDEVLQRDAEHEYKRLLDLLNLLIPDPPEGADDE